MKSQGSVRRCGRYAAGIEHDAKTGKFQTAADRCGFSRYTGNKRSGWGPPIEWWIWAVAYQGRLSPAAIWRQCVGKLRTIRIYNRNGIYYDSMYYANIGFINRYEVSKEFADYLDKYRISDRPKAGVFDSPTAFFELV